MGVPTTSLLLAGKVDILKRATFIYYVGLGHIAVEFLFRLALFASWFR